MKFSKKLAALIVSALALILASYFGIEIDQETKYTLAGLVSAYLLGQGLADVGKEQMKIELEAKEGSQYR